MWYNLRVMSSKGIFLDRDGTINVDKGYVHSIDEFILLPGAVEGLKLLQDMQFKLFIITNQSGIARGYFTEEEYLEFQKWVESYLSDLGIRISGTYYCPHLDSGCECRKPGTKLFYTAAKEHDIDFSRSYAIGDKDRDLSICMAEPVVGLKVGKEGDFDSLLDAAEWIAKKEGFSKYAKV